jgi:DNA-binding SARP family transcriptional activator
VPRERSQRVYVGLLDLLASTAVQRGDVDAALSLLERGVEAEPYEEERYLRAAQIAAPAGG